MSAGTRVYVQTKAVFKAARIKAGLRAPKERRAAPARLTLEEQLQFIDAAYARNGQTGLMVQTLLETGTRGFVAPGEIGIGTAAILRRAGARAANAPRITLAGCGGQAFLNAKLMLPPADHVVDVPELGIPAKPKIRQRDIDRGAAQVRFRVSDAANGKFKQMEAGPPHSHLQNAVQCSQ